MGIIVLFVALLPELGPGARFLYRLEVPGPTAEALVPRIHHTAAVVWKIYLLISGLEALLLALAGMSIYDALTHTFSTMSTGGFSPWNKSVAAFDSPVIEVIIIVFMILAGTNFSLFYGLQDSKGSNLFRDTEFRSILRSCGAVSLILTLGLSCALEPTRGPGERYSMPDFKQYPSPQRQALPPPTSTPGRCCRACCWSD